MFACGGITRDGDRTVISNSSCYFVPDQGKWYHLTSMNKGRHYHGATTDKGYVYAVGEKVSSKRSANVERYEPRINSGRNCWPLAVNIASASCVSLNGVLYVCGGTARVSTGTAEVSRLVYNQATNLWQELSPLNHGRSGLCAVTVNQHIFAIGGRIDHGLKTDTVKKFDPSCNMWELDPSMKEKRVFAYAATYKNKIYVFGGVTGKGQGTNGADSSAECFDAEAIKPMARYCKHACSKTSCLFCCCSRHYIFHWRELSILHSTKQWPL